MTLGAALQGCRVLPAGAWLSLNASPPRAADAAMLGTALASRSRPAVQEITENEAITDDAPLHAVLLRLGPDVRLAVDDAGAGVANVNHLAELRPDFLSIDVGLVRGVHADVGRQAVVAGLVHPRAAVAPPYAPAAPDDPVTSCAGSSTSSRAASRSLSA